MRHSKKNQMIEEMQRLGFKSPLNRDQLLTAARNVGLTVIPLWAVAPERRVARGMFNCPELDGATVNPPAAATRRSAWL